jgi:hypothetical protein
MTYSLYLDNDELSGPFADKSEAWVHAAEHGLVKTLASTEEDPPRRNLDFRYSIRRTGHKSMR